MTIDLSRWRVLQTRMREHWVSWWDWGRSGGATVLLRVGYAATGARRRAAAASVPWEADSEEWQGLAARPNAQGCEGPQARVT